MNLNNFTIKAQESVQKAAEIAQAHQAPSIDTTKKYLFIILYMFILTLIQHSHLRDL